MGKPIPEIHPGDYIRYKKYDHVYNGYVRSIVNEYYFRSGDIQKAYLVTHPQGFYLIPVKQENILGLDVVPQV